MPVRRQKHINTLCIPIFGFLIQLDVCIKQKNAVIIGFCQKNAYSKATTTKLLTRLRSCTYWSALFLFASNIIRFSRDAAHININGIASITHIKGRLLDQAVDLFNCVPFENGNTLSLYCLRDAILKGSTCQVKPLSHQGDPTASRKNAERLGARSTIASIAAAMQWHRQ